MGIQLYRDSNWWRIDFIIPSVNDAMGLDRTLDRELINFLYLHAQEREQRMIARKYHIKERPEEPVNIEDPDDEIYRTYFLFREQVQREPDYDVLHEVAFRDTGNAGKFAFCRLTGFSWPPSMCDAYSYRTFFCGLKSEVMREDIEKLCREMIEKNGPFADAAQEWLAKLPEISDEKLDEWASGDTERKDYLGPVQGIQKFLGTDKGEKYNEEEVAEVIRIAFDAYILMIYEEKNGKLSRRKRREIADEPCLVINELMRQLDRDQLTDEIEGVMSILCSGKLMKYEYTREWIKETAWSESVKRPKHAVMIEIAKQFF